jgi:hypothetical protein
MTVSVLISSIYSGGENQPIRSGSTFDSFPVKGFQDSLYFPLAERTFKATKPHLSIGEMGRCARSTAASGLGWIIKLIVGYLACCIFYSQAAEVKMKE